MKYAIISDIHGNYPALGAVLADVKAQGADKYLLLGDYASGYTFCNEVVEAIRGLENAVIIGGNHEGFLRKIQEDPASVDDRSQLIYWCYDNLTADNLGFLMGLPEMATVSDVNGDIRLNHSISAFFQWPNVLKFFHSVCFREIYVQTPISHSERLKLARDEVLANAGAMAEIEVLPKGVYLFGHNHIQFHMEYNGRLFINPGACGEPLDGECSAAYTLLEDGWVTERRVKYDIGKTIDGLRQSSYNTEGNQRWLQLRAENIETGLDHFRAAHKRKLSLQKGES